MTKQFGNGLEHYVYGYDGITYCLGLLIAAIFYLAITEGYMKGNK